MGLEVVGVASTIDNDLAGSDITIGVDTALNIALEAIDRLKVTASSHQRAFLVEVMGRNCGYLALMAGIAGGAESVVIPEAEVEPEVIARDIQSAYERGKAHALVVVAEGARNNAARAGGALRGAQGTARLRPARDDAGPRAARRHAERVRPPAGDAAGVRGRRLPGARRARPPDRHACRARSRATPLTEVVGHAEADRPRAAQAAEGARAVTSRLSERQVSLLVSVAVIVGGLLLYIPLAGTYGLYDPWETHYSEVARQMTHRGRLHQPVVAGRRRAIPTCSGRSRCCRSG